MDQYLHIGLTHMTHLELLQMGIRNSGKAFLEIKKSETVITLIVKSLHNHDVLALMNGNLLNYNDDEELCIEMSAQMLMLDFCQGSMSILINRRLQES